MNAIAMVFFACHAGFSFFDASSSYPKLLLPALVGFTNVHCPPPSQALPSPASAPTLPHRQKMYAALFFSGRLPRDRVQPLPQRGHARGAGTPLHFLISQ
jgi:hypothetical protein